MIFFFFFDDADSPSLGGTSCRTVNTAKKIHKQNNTMSGLDDAVELLRRRKQDLLQRRSKLTKDDAVRAQSQKEEELRVQTQREVTPPPESSADKREEERLQLLDRKRALRDRSIAWNQRHLEKQAVPTHPAEPTVSHASSPISRETYAHLSSCGQYRYVLQAARSWDQQVAATLIGPAAATRLFSNTTVPH